MSDWSKGAMNAPRAHRAQGYSVDSWRGMGADAARTIPYMLAGSALHDTLAGGVSGAAEKFSAPFHMLKIGRAMMSGDPADIGEALALPKKTARSHC